MQTIFLKILVVGGLVSSAFIAILPLRRQLGDIHELVRRTPRWQRAFLGLFLAVLIAFGGSKNDATNNAALPPPAPTNQLTIVNLNLSPRPCFHPSVTPEDIARGWQLWEVRTNASVGYAMPEGAAFATNWWAHGAYEDVRKEGLRGLKGAFPFGTNEYDSVWVHVWGKTRFKLREASTEIAAVGAPMSAIPGFSRFWTVSTTNLYLLTWENFTLGRLPSPSNPSNPSNTSNFVSAQIELFTSGDFITRSNVVESAFRHIDPDDWDGDGWQNDDDPNPYDWDDFWDDFWQELPEGANASAYCWIDICCDYNSSVVFTGDGDSDLPDPLFMARAGETYRVMLLIGKTYNIESSHPLRVVSKSSGDIEVDGNGTCVLTVVWPVEFSALEGNGLGFMMFVSPSGLGGQFTWTQCCCPITGSGNQFWYAHTGSCCCEGCYAQGYYTWEGYSKSCEGGYCDCSWYDHNDDPHQPQEDDGPYAAGASVSFSKSVVIFEDSYTNMPGEVVARQSTRTILHCVAYGGDKGGMASFTLTGGNRLVAAAGGSLPVTRFVPPCQKLEFDIEYEGKSPSGSERDIVATATFAESGSGGAGSPSTAELTAVKLELRTIYEAPENPNPTRHLYGVGEKVQFEIWPKSSAATFHVDKVDVGDHQTRYDTFGGESTVNAATSRIYRCPAAGTTPNVTVLYDEVRYEPTMAIIEPQFVETPDAETSGWFALGDVCMGIMTTTNNIGPMYVSFKGVKMFEVPCTNAIPPEGYFATINFNGQLTHVVGAGWLHQIGDRNFWMHDQAGREEAYANWSPGRLEWKIPIGWKRYLSDDDDGIVAERVDYENHMKTTSRPLLVGNSAEAYKQVFIINEDGSSAVEKFGYRLQRGRWSLWGTVIKLD